MEASKLKKKIMAAKSHYKKKIMELSRRESALAHQLKVLEQEKSSQFTQMLGEKQNLTRQIKEIERSKDRLQLLIDSGQMEGFASSLPNRAASGIRGSDAAVFLSRTLPNNRPMPEDLTASTKIFQEELSAMNRRADDLLLVSSSRNSE